MVQLLLFFVFFYWLLLFWRNYYSTVRFNQLTKYAKTSLGNCIIALVCNQKKVNKIETLIRSCVLICYKKISKEILITVSSCLCFSDLLSECYCFFISETCCHRTRKTSSRLLWRDLPVRKKFCNQWRGICIRWWRWVRWRRRLNRGWFPRRTRYWSKQRRRSSWRWAWSCNSTEEEILKLRESVRFQQLQPTAWSRGGNFCLVKQGWWLLQMVHTEEGCLE